jgi:hypothetical protein
VTFILRKQFCFVVSGLKIIDDGNPENNLQSHCISCGTEVHLTTDINSMKNTDTWYDVETCLISKVIPINYRNVSSGACGSVVG